jgi:hypothetical protein
MVDLETRAWLDKQYDLRVTVRERNQCVAEWGRLSGAARRCVEGQLDLAFGSIKG